MKEIQYIQSELDKASSLLETACCLMQEGQIVNIASLKRMVSSICEAALENGYRECAALKPSMTDLMRRIDEFSNEMNRQYVFLMQNDTDGDGQ